MSEYRGYLGEALEVLKNNDIQVGDSVKVKADLSFVGIIMPRYEHTDDKHLTIKLSSGYNVGIEVKKIESISKMEKKEKIPKAEERIEKDSSLPDILLLSTGGTIASKVDYRTGAVTPALSAKELNSSVPELSKMANIDTDVLFSEYSENIVPEHWIKIAEKINEYSDSNYSGIILAHGTDTMHYTSSFLSFSLAGFPIPIVLVGSQRSSDRASSDAAINLIAAIRFIIECKTRGVFVAMHQDENDSTVACHFGTRVRKNHTSKRGAFETIGNLPAFQITNDSIKQNEKTFYHVGGYQPKIKLNTNVALLKYYPGFNPKILEDIVDMGYKAVIFEGTGLGHVGKTMYSAIKKTKEKGVFMGMTSQCISGRINMNVYESGRDLLNLGIIPLENMIPEVALVKAMWATGNCQNSEEVEQLMLSNIASEISD